MNLMEMERAGGPPIIGSLRETMSSSVEELKSTVNNTMLTLGCSSTHLNPPPRSWSQRLIDWHPVTSWQNVVQQVFHFLRDFLFCSLHVGLFEGQKLSHSLSNICISHLYFDCFYLRPGSVNAGSHRWIKGQLRALIALTCWHFLSSLGENTEIKAFICTESTHTCLFKEHIHAGTYLVLFTVLHTLKHTLNKSRISPKEIICSELWNILSVMERWQCKCSQLVRSPVFHKFYNFIICCMKIRCFRKTSDDDGEAAASPPTASLALLRCITLTEMSNRASALNTEVPESCSRSAPAPQVWLIVVP